MKEIRLTFGQVALVDDEDFERLNQYKWQAAQDGGRWYGIRSSKTINGKRKTIRMHREILKADESMHIDHVNRNGLDNRKINLRSCTNQQNSFNRKSPHKNNKLGIKGVHFNEKTRRFRAAIRANSKLLHLGYFNVLGDADSAYRKAEEKHFGKYARSSI